MLLKKKRSGVLRQGNRETVALLLHRKEVIQPHVPVGLPCYDLAPVTSPTLDSGCPPKGLGSPSSGVAGSHGLTGGVYKARERIHRAVADARLLAIPPSRGRVADPDPNWGRLSAICSPLRVRFALYLPL